MDYGALTTPELVRACLDDGGELAWEEFVRRSHKLVASVVLRTVRRRGEVSLPVVDELVQETYLKLCADDCRLLRTFHATHEDAIYGFVKVLTANLVHDHFKATRSKRRGGNSQTASLEAEASAPPSALGSVEEIERGVLLREIDTCLRSMDKGAHAERDRRVFWLYFRAGLSANAIADLPSIGLSTKGVESSLLRLTRLVRQAFLARGSEAAPREAAEGNRS